MTTTRIENVTVWTGKHQPGTDQYQTFDAMVIADGCVLALGETAKRIHADVVVDGKGGFICHAFGDGHVHPVFGGLEGQLAPVRGHQDPWAIAKAVGEWARANPKETWIRGEGCDSTLAPSGVFLASWLDAEVPDRPVALRAMDYHTVWANSLALELAGYGPGVQQPHDGEIVCDEAGVPSGTLREWGAWRAVYDLLPPVTQAMQRKALRHAADSFRRSGITWVQDAWVEPGDIPVWLDALEQGILTFRADLALWADPGSWRAQIPAFIEARTQVAERGGTTLSATTVKFFADGVIESGTGSLLAPYCDCPHSHGMANWDAAELAEAVTLIDGLGFNPHIHAIGDGGVRMALDAIESAIYANGPRERRPVIAHLQLVDAGDMARLAELGVIANFEPYWAKFDSWQTELTAPRLGPERTAQQYQMKTMLETGATVSFGSDWPVTTHEPLVGIQVAVTRRMSADPDDPTSHDGQPWMPHERLTVEQALSAYTSGVAQQAGHQQGGMIRPGGRADLVLLAQDPRAVDPMTIATIEVLRTWNGGHTVFEG